MQAAQREGEERSRAVTSHCSAHSGAVLLTDGLSGAELASEVSLLVCCATREWKHSSEGVRRCLSCGAGKDGHVVSLRRGTVPRRGCRGAGSRGWMCRIPYKVAVAEA